MAKTLPGTTIPVDWSRPEEAETRLNSLFLAGGLMLSQVASLTGLEPYVIQNWVRRGFVAPPERKRYSRRQFSRIVLINMLKDSMQLDKICALLSYVNMERLNAAIRDWQGHALVPDERLTNLPETDFMRFGCSKRQP